MHWLTVTEVAHRLDLSAQSVRALLRSGRLSGTRVGVRTWRVAAQVLDEYVTGRTSGVPKQ